MLRCTPATQEGVSRMPRGPNYTPDDDAYIRDNYQSATVRDIARSLGREFRGIQHRAARLGLSKVVLRRWTTKEDDVIRAGIGERLAIVAARLGRRQSEVSTRAKYLGFSFRKPMRPDSKRAHIRAMEKHLGRKVVRGENVHHVNGDHSYNRPDNLHLCANRASHMRAHHSLTALLPQLFERNVVYFDRREGVYRLCETVR